MALNNEASKLVAVLRSSIYFSALTSTTRVLGAAEIGGDVVGAIVGSTVGIAVGAALGDGLGAEVMVGTNVADLAVLVASGGITAGVGVATLQAESKNRQVIMSMALRMVLLFG
ncbi:MAG: hypothetical protein E4H01_16575 [Lysobacterales bacterium]|nr:MAG: hypothetical protein E4H01_16575 [Xanthomonadales bacterium]